MLNLKLGKRYQCEVVVRDRRTTLIVVENCVDGSGEVVLMQRRMNGVMEREERMEVV